MAAELQTKNVKNNFFVGWKQEEWTETEMVYLWVNKDHFYIVTEKDNLIFNGKILTL